MIIGHENQINALKQVVDTEKVSNAYMFSGIEGIGKLKTALYFAKLLNCTSRSKGEDCCGKCKACLQIDNNLYPDVKIFEDQKMIKLATIRSIFELTRVGTVLGKKRVIIINDVENMNRLAGNALLKTLEEPTLENVFILIGHQTHQILPTIRSRCVKIRFSSLSDENLFLILNNLFAGRSAIEIQSAVKFARGSVKKSLMMLEPEKIEQRKDVLRLVKYANDSNFSSEFFQLLDTVSKQVSLKEALEILVFLLRDLLVSKVTEGSQRFVLLSEMDLIKVLQKRLSFFDIRRKIRLVEFFQKNLHLNPNSQMFWEGFLFGFGAKSEVNKNC